MIQSVPLPLKESTGPLEDGTRLRAGPAASWGAIFAGAVVAVATSLTLLTLGAGLGFAAISPWPGQGVAGSTFTITGAIWLIVTQWLSAAMGGYITGRLRHRWLATHTHEVFFRDTAHGLVTWAVATIAVAAVAAGSLNSMAGGATRSMSLITGAGVRGLADGASDSGSTTRPDAGPINAYDVDRLFRTSPATGVAATANAGNAPAGSNSGEVRAEAIHLAMNAVTSGNVTQEDRGHLALLVAAKAGVPQEEAQKRVDIFIAEANDARLRLKAAADEARKAAAETAIFIALAMLIGAFIASVAAAIGGHLRDEHL
jgi:hypothetical protein